MCGLWKCSKRRPVNRLCGRSSIGSTTPMFGCENRADSQRFCVAMQTRCFGARCFVPQCVPLYETFSCTSRLQATRGKSRRRYASRSTRRWRSGGKRGRRRSYPGYVASSDPDRESVESADATQFALEYLRSSSSNTVGWRSMLFFDRSPREWILIPEPFDNVHSHLTCCHLDIGAGTRMIPIQ